MGVYFALRTHYDHSTGKYLRHFPEDHSVLAWFQRHWRGKSEEDGEASRFTEEVLGCRVYGFDSLFMAIAEHNLTAPQTMRQLSVILHKHLYAEGEVRTSANAIQVLTDDDELELAYYFFDDYYIGKEPEKAAYLLHDDWQLPESSEPITARLPRLPDAVELFETGGKTQGAVYGVFLSFYDSASLTDIYGSFQIPRIRLSQFVSYLREKPVGDRWFFEMKILRALTESPKVAPHAVVTLADILTQARTIPVSAVDDELYKHDFGGTNTPAEDFALLSEVMARNKTERVLLSGKDSLVQIADHVAQLCLHSDTWIHSPGNETKLFARWIFFDDIWLRANPALGRAILRFGTRWDVLS